MTELVKYTTVKVVVDGITKEIKMQDGIALNDSKTGKKFLFKNGKWLEPDYKKGVNYSQNSSSDTPAVCIRKWNEYDEYEGGFLGFFQTQKQPEINLSQVQMKCLEALMDNDGQDGLSIQDIKIGREQYRQGRLSADFAKHLPKGVQIDKTFTDGVNDDCMRIGLRDKNIKSWRNFSGFQIDYIE